MEIKDRRLDTPPRPGFMKLVHEGDNQGNTSVAGVLSTIWNGGWADLRNKYLIHP